MADRTRGPRVGLAPLTADQIDRARQWKREGVKVKDILDRLSAECGRTIHSETLRRAFIEGPSKRELATTAAARAAQQAEQDAAAIDQHLADIAAATLLMAADSDASYYRTTDLIIREDGQIGRQFELDADGRKIPLTPDQIRAKAAVDRNRLEALRIASDITLQRPRAKRMNLELQPQMSRSMELQARRPLIAAPTSDSRIARAQQMQQIAWETGDDRMAAEALRLETSASQAQDQAERLARKESQQVIKTLLDVIQRTVSPEDLPRIEAEMARIAALTGGDDD